MRAELIYPTGKHEGSGLCRPLLTLENRLSEAQELALLKEGTQENPCGQQELLPKALIPLPVITQGFHIPAFYSHTAIGALISEPSLLQLQLGC